MSTHTIAVEIEVEVSEDEVIYPMIEITYDYSRGHPGYTPPGEYAPIDQPEPSDIEFRGAELVKGDELPAIRVQKLAEEWLMTVGYTYAIDAAETDLRAMRHVQ